MVEFQSHVVAHEQYGRFLEPSDNTMSTMTILLIDVLVCGPKVELCCDSEYSVLFAACDSCVGVEEVVGKCSDPIVFTDILKDVEGGVRAVSGGRLDASVVEGQPTIPVAPMEHSSMHFENLGS